MNSSPSAESKDARDQDRPAGSWPEAGSVPVSVLVPVKNESSNITDCLKALQFAEQIVVVDSQSTDDTVELSEAMGAEVVQFHYSKSGWPKKKNWALENVPWRHEWVLIMDADERMTAKLAREIEDVVAGRFPNHPRQQLGDGDGFYINRRFIFMGRWIKHCGYYPSYNVRLFKHAIGRYERIGDLGDTNSGDNEVHEHVVLRNGSTPGYLANDFDHLAYPNLQVWIEKHNRYSNWEAHAMLAGVAGELHASLTHGSTQRRRWIKHKVRNMPFRPTMRFLYSYVLKLGFLDGYPGYVLSRLMSWYEFVSLAKRYEINHESSEDPSRATQNTTHAANGSASNTNMPTVDLATDSPHPGHAVESGHPEVQRQMQPESSPWPLKAKIGRALWMILGQPLMKCSFHNWYAYRNLILRMFGAKVGKKVVVRPSAHIEIPWMLDIQDGASIGDHAIIYCLGRVTIGKRAIISQYAHLCAGTHDYTDHTFRLLRTPITIGDDCWVGADAFVGPGVTIGTGSILGARSSAFKDLPEWQVCVGEPAKPIKKRLLR